MTGLKINVRALETLIESVEKAMSTWPDWKKEYANKVSKEYANKKKNRH